MKYDAPYFLVLTKATYSQQFMVSYNARKGSNPKKLTVIVVRLSCHIKKGFTQQGYALSI